MIDEIAKGPIAQPTERPIGEPEVPAYPGDINVGGGFFDGHYPGNKLVFFGMTPEDYDASRTNDEDVIALKINAFFSSYPGAMVSGFWPVQSGVYVLFTRLMSREEAEGIAKYSAEVKAKLAAEAAKRAELEAEQARREAERAKEERRLAELGRICEANHKKTKKAAEE